MIVWANKSANHKDIDLCIDRDQKLQLKVFHCPITC